MNLRAGGEFDRYIPRRSSSDLAHLNLTNNSSDDDLLNVEFDDEKNGYPHPIFANTAKRANNMISYKNRILGALGITSSSIFKPSNKREYITNNIEARSWPVKSRKMPLIKAPETLLDMPGAEGFDNVIIRHMIDWSSKGIIATIFREEVHLWSEGLGQLGQTNTNRTVANCVKWNKSGSKFAVARTSSKVSIIDGATLKVQKTVTCKCGEGCEISGIAWTNNDQMIGVCWLGSISILDVASGLFKCYHTFCRSEIFDIQLSCNDKYFFLLSTTKNKVNVFDRSIAFTFNQSHKTFTCREFSGECATWHPWQESSLIIANKSCDVTQLNMNNFSHESVVLRPYFKSPDNCILDFLTFNPRSAELLASFYYENPREDSINGCNFLTVFSSLHNRVDEVRFHVGRVPYVIWDGTGTKLASVGTDENLALWNFFGADPETHKMLNREPKRHPRVFDFQYLFDTCLR